MVDMRQVPPVKDSPLYSPIEILRGATAVEGRAMYDSFEICFFPHTSFRQSAAQQQFGDLLDRLAAAKSTAEDCGLLMTRRASEVIK